MTDIVERLNDSLSAGYSELRKEAAEEIMRLRAKIEQMERQDGKKGVRASEQSIQDVAMIARNGIDRIIKLERENKRLNDSLHLRKKMREVQETKS